MNKLLLCCILSPLLGAVVLFVLPGWDTTRLRKIALVSSCMTLLQTLMLWIIFDYSVVRPQFSLFQSSSQVWQEDVPLGLDGLSLLFIVLTAFTLPVCLLLGWERSRSYVKEYCLLFLLLEFLMLGVFCSLDLLVFYVFFEGVLIPMFLIIGIWGSRLRRIRAAYQFFLFTLFGSLLMLLGILLLFLQTGSLDYSFLATSFFSEKRQTLLWLLFFTSFAVKVPMVPVHIWLPEAHVEAPTAGSVILAGILLKLGAYGFLRFSIPLFPKASLLFSPLV